MTTKLEDKYPTLKVGLSMAKAEGNLKFLAQCDMATFTQGEAVLDALHALQEASKAYAEVTKELNELKTSHA